MSVSFQAKNSLVLGRQLECQEVVANCDLVNALSDAPGMVAIDNSTLTATVVTLTVGEVVSKCILAEVRNRTTGAVVAIAAAPSLAVAQKISVTCNGTGLTDVCVVWKYKVAE
jgi:hypothetical protein